MTQIDLHIHTNFPDGTLSAEDAIIYAKNAGIKALLIDRKCSYSNIQNTVKSLMGVLTWLKKTNL